MKLAWPRRHAPIELVDLVPLEPPIELRLGLDPCGALRCEKHSGLRCAYVDRRGRRCPTAWCPEHRSTANGFVYCSVHANTMSGIEWEYGSAPHPDLENRIPAVINWLARATEDDVVATLHSVCGALGEVLVSDPVRFVLVPPDRVRTWERVWKTCSTTGVTCRVAIAVEEKSPNAVLIKVNSMVVKTVATPWERALRIPDPDSMEWLFRHVVMPVSFALDQWLQSSEIKLRGTIHSGAR